MNAGEVDYERRLLELIDRALDGDYGLGDFEYDYQFAYANDGPEEFTALTADGLEFFDDVSERLTFTAGTLDEVTAKLGYVDWDAFLAWLRGARDDYRRMRG